MIKVKEYNFACEIVKVDLSVRPYILEFGDNQTGKRDRLAELSHRPTHSKTFRSLQSLFGILQLGVLLHKCIYI